MGSEKYPYKGILGQLANRAFSSGTNAHTITDHTSYTVSTAGEQGFLQLLPVYIDHILYPTLTEAAFLTEVGLRRLRTEPKLTAPRRRRSTMWMEMGQTQVLCTAKCRDATTPCGISTS